MKKLNPTLLLAVTISLCANSALVGQGSAATIARLIDMSRGFVVLDDIESIGNNKVDAQFSELIQGLKLSHKKSTAAKIWTDIKTMKVEKLNFFGIKMINNTPRTIMPSSARKSVTDIADAKP